VLKHTGVVQPIPLGLVNVGPLVQVQLSHHPAAPPPVPVAPLAVWLMIDTGAQRTVIEKRLASQLGLTPIRFQQMVGVSQIPEMCPVYLMSVTLSVGGDGQVLAITFSTEVIGMSSPPQPREHVGLLGRDFLRHMKLVYDGPRGSFELIPEIQDAHESDAPTTRHSKLTRGRAKATPKRKEARQARRKNRSR
jgi:predicted aspartyl protease